MSRRRICFSLSLFHLSRNHLKVIFQIQGSIWPKVLPLCLFNVVVTILIYTLRTWGIIDLHFDGGKGMQYISVLVSFFVVSSIGTTYNRYWEARAYVGKALLSASLLADRAAIYSSNSQSDKAQTWRNALQHRLSQLVQYSMHLIQNERGALVNIITTQSEKEMTGDDTSDALLQKHGLRRTFVANHIGLLEEKERAMAGGWHRGLMPLFKAIINISITPWSSTKKWICFRRPRPFLMLSTPSLNSQPHLCLS